MLQPHQITGRLIEKGFSVTGVAEDLGVTQSTVSSVITKAGTSERIKKYIAELLGESYEFVWGPRQKKRRRRSKRN